MTGANARFSAIVLAALVATTAGCTDGDIITSYGMRGGFGSASVNGTTVLGEMFEQAGHQVESRRALTPYLRNVDTIVWAPDSFKEPGPQVREWLENWLTEQPGRTLIYIARDFDAAPLYWQTIRSGAPAEQQAELKQRYSRARNNFSLDQSDGTVAPTCPWFTIERPKREHQAHTFEGPWSEDIDGGRAKVMLYSRLKPSAAAEALLTFKDEVIVARQAFAATSGDWDFYYREQPQTGGSQGYIDESYTSAEEDLTAQFDEPTTDGTTGDETNVMSDDDDGQASTEYAVETTSQLITVVNGSFLLNFPLVNYEHRKLAGKLIASTAVAGHTVFLESGAGDPPILAQEPEAEYGPGLKYLDVWPVGPIILHLAVLGIIFCFARWPIFGTPLTLPAAGASDFGKHVQALGKLLGRTKDHSFATGRIENYQTKRREGKRLTETNP